MPPSAVVQALRAQTSSVPLTSWMKEHGPRIERVVASTSKHAAQVETWLAELDQRVQAHVADEVVGYDKSLNTYTKVKQRTLAERLAQPLVWGFEARPEAAADLLRAVLGARGWAPEVADQRGYRQTWKIRVPAELSHRLVDAVYNRLAGRLAPVPLTPPKALPKRGVWTTGFEGEVWFAESTYGMWRRYPPGTPIGEKVEHRIPPDLPEQWMRRSVPADVEATMSMIAPFLQKKAERYGLVTAFWDAEWLVGTDGIQIHMVRVTPNTSGAPWLVPADPDSVVSDIVQGGWLVSASDVTVVSRAPDWRMLWPARSGYQFTLSAADVARLEKAVRGPTVALVQISADDDKGAVHLREESRSVVWGELPGGRQVPTYFDPEVFAKALKPFVKRKEGVTFGFTARNDALAPMTVVSATQRGMLMPTRPS